MILLIFVLNNQQEIIDKVASSYLTNEAQYYQGKLVSYYSGAVSKQLKSGFGYDTFINGSKYQGNYLDNKFDGIGSFQLSPQVVIQGTFKKNSLVSKDLLDQRLSNVIHLYLSATFQSVIIKSRYRGQLNDQGEYHGFGELFENGQIVRGRFRNGEIIGRHRINYYNQNEWFVDIDRNANLIYEVGSDFKYVGNALSKEPSVGKYYFSNNSTVSGQFCSGFASTLVSRITYPNGSFYEGEHIKNTPNGMGRFTLASGKVKQGVWERGKLVQKQEVHEALIQQVSRIDQVEIEALRIQVKSLVDYNNLRFGNVGDKNYPNFDWIGRAIEGRDQEDGNGSKEE